VLDPAHARHVVEEDGLDHDAVAARDDASQQGQKRRLGAVRVLENDRLQHATPRAPRAVPHFAPSLSHDDQKGQPGERGGDRKNGENERAASGPFGSSSLRTRATSLRALNGFTTYPVGALLEPAHDVLLPVTHR
jgi:hypothetical protein